MTYHTTAILQEPLQYDATKGQLISPSINVAYRVTKDGIPNLVPSNAVIVKDQ